MPALPPIILNYIHPEHNTYLDKETFPVLAPSARERLDGPITLEEAQQALGSLQSGKTPGMVGFPPEFYKQYAEEVAPRLHKMLVRTLKEGTLPPSMAQAIIVVVPKPEKDLQLCTSYHPISLLNTDAKILPKKCVRREVKGGAA